MSEIVFEKKNNPKIQDEISINFGLDLSGRVGMRASRKYRTMIRMPGLLQEASKSEPKKEAETAMERYKSCLK